MYRNRIIYLSRSGISSFSFLEVIPNPKSKPPKVTTIYDSQTGDPEFNVSFREDIGPFRKAAVWEWMTRGVGRAELEKSEKKVKQRRRFATYVLGNGNAPGSSGLRTEVLTDEEEKVREEKNRIVYDEWQKLLNGEGEW
jgi:hypothetical protein